MNDTPFGGTSFKPRGPVPYDKWSGGRVSSTGIGGDAGYPIPKDPAAEERKAHVSGHHYIGADPCK